MRLMSRQRNNMKVMPVDSEACDGLDLEKVTKLTWEQQISDILMPVLQSLEMKKEDESNDVICSIQLRFPTGGVSHPVLMAGRRAEVS